MKLRLNHKNPLDQKLQERLQHAEAMPPSFQKLFGHLPTHPTGRYSLRKWLHSSLFLFSATSMLLFSLVLNSDSELVKPNTQLASIINSQGLVSSDLPQANLKKKNRQVTKETKLYGNAKETSSLYAANETTISYEQAKTILAGRNQNTASSFQKLTSATPKKTVNISVEALASFSKMPTKASEPHSVHLLLNQASISQSEEIKSTLQLLPVLSSTEAKQKRGSWFVGLMGAMNSTWILNQNTYGEFNGYEFAYKLDWGYQYGMRMGYHPAKKGWGFELGYVPVSEKGQKYEDIIQAQKQHREVNLNYAQTVLKLKFRQPFSKRAHGTAINWEIGGAYNQLHNAYQNNNGNWSEITNRFRKNSWQVSLGTSLDIPISQSVFYTIGLQGAMSTDINSKGWRSPGSYGKSHTIALGIQTGVSYQFR